MNERFDVIVIGGGHNGLTHAAYLARAGLSTLVLERRDIVGGCCGTTAEHVGAVVERATGKDLREVLRDLLAGEREPLGVGENRLDRNKGS